jgi:eukaryotic-like serine/threonine-protein kinase
VPPAAAGTVTPPPDSPVRDGGEQPTVLSNDPHKQVLESADHAHSPSALAPGQIFGSRYRIITLLGQGGMGAVYQAWDEELGVVVALKVIRPEVLEDPVQALDLQRRFKRELLLARQISHKNVVRIHDLGKVGSIAYLTMTYVKGQDLATILKREGRLSVARALRIARQVAAGLAAAHEQGVVHRDLKPANIMLDEDGHALIMDFGIARSVVGGGTVSGAIVGTLAYMAPEQARGETVDQRVDVYAFGLILYDLLLGRRVSSSEESEMGELLRRMEHAPPSARSLDPGIPGPVDELIARCLRPAAAERYQTSAELLADLARLDQDGHATRHSPRAITPIPKGLPATKQTARGVAPRLRRSHMVAAAVLVLGLVIGIVVARWWPGGRPPPLTQRDSILLADFVNTTGEAVFDGALKQALAVQLEQSPFLDVFSEQRVRETLRFMGRPPDERLTPTVAREVCEREGIKAMLSGSIATIGLRYVIDLNAVNCQTGESLAREQMEAANNEQVLQALGTATSRLREKLGESLSSIQRFDAPIAQATTGSLDALKAFSLGQAQRAQGVEVGALPFYKRAVELDPNFALAYARLAAIHANIGELEPARGYLTQAYERRERVSEREKLYIASRYHDIVSGQVDQSLETFQLWTQTYPRDWGGHNNLAYVCTIIGQFDKAAEAAQEAKRLVPNHPFPYGNLGFAYLGMGRLDEAKAVFEEAVSRKIDDLPVHVGLYEIAFAQGDAAAQARESQWATGKRRQEWMLFTQAQAAAAQGKLRLARETVTSAVTMVKDGNLKDFGGLMLAWQALAEAEFGNHRLARERAAQAVAIARGRDTMMVAATALALAGDALMAQALSNELTKRLPTDSLANGLWLPAARTALEISRRRDAKAVASLLQPPPMYDTGRMTRQFGSLAPVYVRGLAQLHAGSPADAVNTFKKIVSHRGVAPVSEVHPMAVLGLARALAMSGDSAGSRTAYQDFFALWKDADPDVPVLRSAREEYDKLTRLQMIPGPQ